MRFNPSRLALALAPLMLATLSGCSVLMPASITNTKTDVPVDSPKVSLEAGDGTVSLMTARQDVVLEAVPADGDDPLPKTPVPPLAATGLGHIEALRLLLDGGPFSLSIVGDARAFEGSQTGSLRMGATTLADAAESLSRSGGFFLSVHGDKVIASATKRFVIDVPHVLDDKAAAGLVNTMRRLGARDVFHDANGNTITFDASRTAWSKIESYLDYMRRSKPMLAYEVEVYQVELNDAHSSGVNFSKLAKNLVADAAGGGAMTRAASTWSLTKSGENLGSQSLSFVTKDVSMSMVLGALKSQGTVSSLSRPRVALLSGTESKFRVGRTTKYVSKISQTNNGTATTGNQTAQTTSSSETAEVKTGFDMKVKGVFKEGTVTTVVSLEISELIKFNDFEAFGTKLRLPDTKENEIETTVEARPGDMLLLGGMGTNSQKSAKEGGVSGFSLSGEAARTEIVLALRPRVIRFVTSKDVQQ
jgi:MSHA biogenesis protein MshL